MAEVAQGGTRALPWHYGWVIVATGTLTNFACLGLGRFALGMLLPSMGQSLSLSYDEMGYIGTGNFVGYLAAVLASGRLTGRVGARRLVASGLLLVGGSMLLVSRAGSFLEIMTLYFVTGIGSGIAYVPLMGLVSHWFARSRRGKAAGFIVIGSGFAIIFSGMTVPAINAAAGAEGWRASWLLLGGLSLAAGLAAHFLLRNHPAELGLEPLGHAPAALGDPHPPAAPPSPAAARRLVAHIGAIYFAYGYTYVIYATFIVTTLVQERGFSEAAAGRFWAWAGFLSLFSGPVFGSVSDRLGRRTTLAVVFAMQMTAYLLIAAALPDGFVYLSIALFGVSVWSIPGIMGAIAGDYMGPERAVSAFAVITFFFGIGQIVGPALAGELAKWSGSFSSSYFMAAAVAAAAILLTSFLRKPQGH